ncbi:MAG: hypothetical protein P4K78_00805 [Terracidiphilus sp.]|nr:hypothetical protein [Terracidiphilus sp.]
MRSLVDRRTGKCKTEASAKLLSFDEYTAKDLLAWYGLTPYSLAQMQEKLRVQLRIVSGLRKPDAKKKGRPAKARKALQLVDGKKTA